MFSVAGRAAVFHMGPEHGAKCGCCGLEPSCWAAGDSPTRGRHGPRPLRAHSALSWGGRDRTDGQILSQLRPPAEEEEEDGVGAAPSARPAFPGMGSEELRLASFYDWPPSAVVPPELLAAAGFFHTGQQDKVRCFFCCGGLQRWERGDDPWTEHARWFPRCEFLLQTKGKDFVCSVQEGGPSGWALGGPPAPCGGGRALPVWPASPVGQDEGRRSGRGGAVAGHPGGEPGAAPDAEEQLQRLREERTCRVCLDRAVAVVFVPCGHLACGECAPSLQRCPVCRAPIRSCVRTFLV
uniref:RING-type E3 ubiquitin transferase n=1 Tax=Catagonus wagneri TaxID=51154 RepID=A0A8C3WV09_9CETA